MSTSALTPLPHEIEHFLNYLISLSVYKDRLPRALRAMGIGFLTGYASAKLADLRDLNDNVLGINMTRRALISGTLGLTLGSIGAADKQNSDTHAAFSDSEKKAVRHEDTPEIYAGLAERLKTDRTLYDLTINSFSFQKL